MPAGNDRSWDDASLRDSLKLYRRDQSDINLAVSELVGTLRWSMQDRLEKVGLGTLKDSPGERNSVQIFDDGDFCLRHV